MTLRVKYELAQKKILDVMKPILLSWPEWIDTAVKSAQTAIEDMTRAVPDESLRIEAELARIDKEVSNLLDALASGIKSEAVGQRLAQMEVVKGRLQQKSDELAHVRSAPTLMPSAKWIAEQLREIGTLLQTNLAAVAQPLRHIIGEIKAEEVKIVGRKRGYVRLRFCIDGWAAIKPLLQKTLTKELLEQLQPTEGTGEEFVIDLGARSRLDELAPQIVEMRDGGAKWREILAHFHAYALTLGKAWGAYARWKRYEGRAKAA